MVGAPPPAAEAIVPARAEAELGFVVGVPADTILGRHVLTIDADLWGEPRGELAETLLEVLPA